MNQLKLKYRFLISVSILLIVSYGCNYLDEIPDDRQTIEEVFQKKNPVRRLPGKCL